MRTLVMVALVNSLGASAVPANGVAIARVGQQVDPVINPKKKTLPRLRASGERVNGLV
jgi:hypothetical protein